MTDLTALVTANEADMLRSIMLNTFMSSNGSEPQRFSDVDCGCWSNLLDDSAFVVPAKSRPGLCSSLVQKGLLFATKEGRDSVIGPTEKGWEVYVALRASGRWA